MHHNLGDKVEGGAVFATTVDAVFQFAGDPTTPVEEILVMRQNGAAFTATVTAGSDGSTYGTTVGTATNVKAITVRGGITLDYVKVAVVGQPALMMVTMQHRKVSAPQSALTHFEV